MLGDITVLSSRRSYEFAVDDLRLTLLANAGVLQHVQQQFAFAAANIATPMEFFGPVTSTLLPGLVFNFGVSAFPEPGGTSIRFLHFEQRRVVIDVAGPSSVLDPTFSVFREMLSELRAPDGSPAIGEPTHRQDFSEITFKLPFGSEALLSPNLRSIMNEAIAPTRTGSGTLAASVLLQLIPDGEEYPGLATRDHRTARIEPRAGSSPADRLFFSSAPIDSDSRIALVERLENALLSNTEIAGDTDRAGGD